MQASIRYNGSIAAAGRTVNRGDRAVEMILGLDLGVQSVGWAVVRRDEEDRGE